uniref:Putative secreted protein n=1 Tax=Panstrongylus lignarius TaxID=156445 RepID=A0A224Y5A6_9HEMI
MFTSAKWVIWWVHTARTFVSIAQHTAGANIEPLWACGSRSGRRTETAAVQGGRVRLHVYRRLWTHQTQVVLHQT